MSRIAIDARIIYTSTGRYVERLLQHLQEIDHDNEYVVLLLKKDYERWQPQAANFTKCLADYPPYTLSEQLGLGRLLHRLRPDLIHFTMPQQPLSWRGRSVTTIHDLTLLSYVNRRPAGPVKGFYKYRAKPAVFQVVFRRFARRSRQVIVPTDYVARQVVSRLKVPAGRVTVTPEAAERLAITPQPLPAYANTKFTLYVGNTYPYKNVRRLIDAVSQTDTQLVLAGKPDYFYEQLQTHAAARGFANIHFAGFVSDAELAWLYQHAELYLFPSLSEGFGLPGLEAMSYGLPVAAANASCLPEVYGDAAVYFDPRDTADMARVITQTLADPKQLAALKAAGRERVKQFSWAKMAQQTLEVYQKALRQ